MIWYVCLDERVSLEMILIVMMISAVDIEQRYCFSDDSIILDCGPIAIVPFDRNYCYSRVLPPLRCF